MKFPFSELFAEYLAIKNGIEMGKHFFFNTSVLSTEKVLGLFPVFSKTGEKISSISERVSIVKILL